MEKGSGTPAEIKGMMAAEESTGTGETKKMKVVVAVDGSEESMHALGWALDHLFTATGGLPETSERLGTLVVVHAQPPVHYMMQPVGPAVYATSSVLNSVKQAHEQNSALLLSKAAQICKERLVEAKAMVVEGDPKDVICRAAEEVEADLLVVGSRGLSMLKRAFLGSVSDYVAHHADCPVLIVKPPKAHHGREAGAAGGARA